MLRCLAGEIHMTDITDETKQNIMEFQAYQQQLQSVAMQKESLKLQDLEIDKALEELQSTKQKTAYKMTGTVMVSKTVEEIVSDLKDTKEAIGVRLNTFDKTESRITEKLKELQGKIKEAMK